MIKTQTGRRQRHFGGGGEWSGWDGLVAYWPLGEASGDAIDAVGSEDFTENNTVDAYTDGISGGARTFNGTNDSFSVTGSTSSALHIGNQNKTIAVWCRPHDITSRGIIGGVTSPNNYYLNINSSSKLQLYNYEEASSIASTDAVQSTNRWILAVMYHDADNDEYAVSLNGATPDTRSYSGGFPTTTPGTYRFGRNHSAYADGELSHIMVWDRVLTDDEISELYRSGAGRFRDSSNVEVTNYDAVCFSHEHHHSNITLSNRGRTMTEISGTTNRSAYSLNSYDLGSNHYQVDFEVVNFANDMEIGFGTTRDTTSLVNQGGAGNYGWRRNGNWRNNNSGSTTLSTYTTGDILTLRVDNGSVYCYKNNTIENSGTAVETGLGSGFYLGGTVKDGGDSLKILTSPNYGLISGATYWPLSE